MSRPPSWLKLQASSLIGRWAVVFERSLANKNKNNMVVEQHAEYMCDSVIIVVIELKCLYFTLPFITGKMNYLTSFTLMSLWIWFLLNNAGWLGRVCFVLDFFLAQTCLHEKSREIKWRIDLWLDPTSGLVFLNIWFVPITQMYMFSRWLSHIERINMWRHKPKHEDKCPKRDGEIEHSFLSPAEELLLQRLMRSTKMSFLHIFIFTVLCLGTSWKSADSVSGQQAAEVRHCDRFYLQHCFCNQREKKSIYFIKSDLLSRVLTQEEHTDLSQSMPVRSRNE